MHVVEEWLPYLDYKTYVRIVEPDRPARRATPLVLLHGGPGSTEVEIGRASCRERV